MNKIRRTIMTIIFLPILANCGGGSGIGETGGSEQSTESLKPKADILLVVSNSNTMESTQINTAVYFKNFITPLQNKNIDYRLAVTSTDAYRALFAGGPICSQFRDGPVRFVSTSNTCENTGTHNGVRIMTPTTLNLSAVFSNNVRQGTRGHGDKRSFQSLRVALEDPLNSGFLRPDSFLGIIIFAEQDDFSHDGSNSLQNERYYNDPRIHTIKSYTDFLDAFTGTAGPNRRYSVSSMAINDPDCVAYRNMRTPGHMLTPRIEQLVDATGGEKADICDRFPSDLARITESIAKRASER